MRKQRSVGKKDTIDFGRTRIDLARLQRVLRERREKLGYSVRDVARLTNLSPTTVSNFEQGAYRIQLDKFLKILEVLSLSPADVLIIDGVSCDPPPTPFELEVADLLRTRDYAALFRMLSDHLGDSE